MENHEYKLDIELKPIEYQLARNLVKKYHYSKTLPKTTNLCLGVYINGILEGTITLGHGTRPSHTV